MTWDQVITKLIPGREGTYVT